MHFAVGGDEHHVERDQRVLHPHGCRLRLVVEKEHAGILRQRAAEHEAERALPIGGGNFDVEAVVAAIGLEQERAGAGGEAARLREDAERKQRQRRRAGQPVKRPQCQWEDGPCEPSGLSSAAINPFGPRP